jgi:hypothetical protein
MAKHITSPVSLTPPTLRHCVRPLDYAHPRMDRRAFNWRPWVACLCACNFVFWMAVVWYSETEDNLRRFSPGMPKVSAPVVLPRHEIASNRLRDGLKDYKKAIGKPDSRAQDLHELLEEFHKED